MNLPQLITFRNPDTGAVSQLPLSADLDQMRRLYARGFTRYNDYTCRDGNVLALVAVLSGSYDEDEERRRASRP